MGQRDFPKEAPSEALHKKGKGPPLGRCGGRSVQGRGNQKRQCPEAGQAWCSPGATGGLSRLMSNEQER